jgi:hypothetical protein
MPPTGAIRLPDDIYTAFLDFNAILRRLSLSESVTEDLSTGHSLVSDPDARRIQERFIEFAAERMDAVREALHRSGDEGHRAAAAYVIGYAPDKQVVVEDLVRASSDASASVRTNATRALAAIATLGSARPELGISIPPSPFITMVNSVMYDERSRGIRVLRALSAGRDPEVLAAIRAGALAALVEMSRWTYSGHNRAPYQVLGRVLGMREEEIDRTIDSDREAALARAMVLLN